MFAAMILRAVAKDVPSGRTIQCMAKCSADVADLQKKHVA